MTGNWRTKGKGRGKSRRQRDNPLRAGKGGGPIKGSPFAIPDGGFLMDKDKSKDRDEGIPWCGDCGSYHSPKNPTCRKLWPKEYTLLAAGNGMYLAEELWHSPLDGWRGPMRQAWVWVAEDLLFQRTCSGVPHWQCDGPSGTR
jgi:hypothetical protein